MPYRICKSLEIENGHMLSKHPDACRFPHGHSRRIEFVLEADALDDRGMVCDFKIIKQAVGDYLDTFDHAMCMNTSDPMYETMKQTYGERILGFEDTEPTTEVLAKTIFDTCLQALADYAREQNTRYPLAPGVRLVSVRVWETSSSWAEFSG
jgi:6-pyruvoyltetrahydropterin/6-carboxytetrahydropterin synthase